MVRPIAPVIEYVIDQEYIAEFLCINKDRPELACEGKCYLMQMLQEQEDQKKMELPLSDLSEYPIGFVLVQKVLTTANTLAPRKDFTFRKKLYTYRFCPSDFHPPTVSS